MPRRTIEASTNTAYIEPISDCNLSCRMCYSRVSRERPPISKEDCIAFADRFAQFCDGNFELYWSGTGEVFLHRDFPEIINVLSRRHTGRIRHTIMTNGTLDRLDEFDTDMAALSEALVRATPKCYACPYRRPVRQRPVNQASGGALTIGCRPDAVYLRPAHPPRHLPRPVHPPALVPGGTCRRAGGTSARLHRCRSRCPQR